MVFIDVDRMTKKLVIYILLDPPIYPPLYHNLLVAKSLKTSTRCASVSNYLEDQDIKVMWKAAKHSDQHLSNEFLYTGVIWNPNIFNSGLVCNQCRGQTALSFHRPKPIFFDFLEHAWTCSWGREEKVGSNSWGWS